MTIATDPQRLAAPAPHADPADFDAAIARASNDHIDALCVEWASWSRTRRYYGPPPLSAGVLGKLTQRSARRKGGPDAHCSAAMPALNMAIAAQPMDNAKRVFLLHYLHNVANIKIACSELGISRASWYRLLSEFRERVYAAHHRILAENLAARDALAHQS